MHPESGLLAVHLAGLDEEFRTIARYEDQGMRFLNKEGRVLFQNDQNQETGNRPEVDRTELRAMLLDSLAPSVVRWGHHLRSVRQAQDGGTHELVFEHGLNEHFDLVESRAGSLRKWSSTIMTYPSGAQSLSSAGFSAILPTIQCWGITHHEIRAYAKGNSIYYCLVCRGRSL